MSTESSPGEKVVFYVKCRPRGHDLWALAKAHRKVFIGYPAWKPGIANDVPRSEWPNTLQDISSRDFAKSMIRDKAWTSHISANRNLSLRIGKGSIVLVPRPADGVCHVGRVEGPFEIASAPTYVDAAMGFKNSDYKTELDLWGDVAQTWPVESWVCVPFAFLPGWTRYRLLSQNMIGEIKHPDAFSVMEKLLANPAIRPGDLSRTDDPPKVLARMLYSLTPTSFEHLSVDLLQLEFPAEHWLHVGGSGDGGVDGIGFGQSGEVLGSVQCKWALPGKPIAKPPLAGPGIRHYITSLSAQRWQHAPVYATMLYGTDIARMLIKHSEEVPVARTLGVVSGS